MTALPHALFLANTDRNAPGNGVPVVPVLGARADVASIDAALSAGVAMIGLAGCRRGADIQRLAALLSVVEAKRGRTDGTTAILALTDGILPAPAAAEGLAGKSARLAALVWHRPALEQALVSARAQTPAFAAARAGTLLAAAAAGVPAYDWSCDLTGEDLTRACEVSRDEGFHGRIALDAVQAAVIAAIYPAR